VKLTLVCTGGEGVKENVKLTLFCTGTGGGKKERKTILENVK
jgi:hypothetical protein